MSAVTFENPAGASMRTLIDDLLAEQQSLTAVDRFARQHERGETPAQARYYRELIPLTQPERGEQYAFAVDLDACSGCKACVNACHSLNGLDEDEIWRNVGVIVGGTVEQPYQQTVTTACHHCVEPGCLLGCPVMAYEKDARTGIVRHLDDQCIGCQYCVLKCPYDVPKYSKERGIVRKCDMCYHRLAAEEAPACVQACPSSAITIRIVSARDTRIQDEPGARLIPGAFDSRYTRPATAYTTRKSIPPNARAGDSHRLRLEEPHWPLIWLSLLSQLSAGVFVCLALMTCFAASTLASGAAPLSIIGFVALLAGLFASVFHLGRPWKAWRFFLGLRTSWMSREILVFGLWAPMNALCVLGAFRAQASGLWGEQACSLLSAFLGLAGIFCSVMIYVDTRRPFWSASLTFPKFFGTTFLLGAAASAAILSWTSLTDPAAHSPARVALITAVITRVFYAAWGSLFFHRALGDSSAAAHRSARTIWKLLRRQFWWRVAFVSAATIAGTSAVFAEHRMQAISATAFFLFTFGAAIIERYCFFTASDAPRMPGGIGS